MKHGYKKLMGIAMSAVLAASMVSDCSAGAGESSAGAEAGSGASSAASGAESGSASAEAGSEAAGSGAADAQESASPGGEDGVFTIAYAPNESTTASADARNGLAEDLGAYLGCEVEEIRPAITTRLSRHCVPAARIWPIWAPRLWPWAWSARIWSPS